MEEKRLPLPHRLTLQERQQLTVTGVREVMRFDETAVVLRTELGTLVIQGRDLIAMGMEPGPEFGSILKRAYEAQLDGIFFDREGGMKYLAAKI